MDTPMKNTYRNTYEDAISFTEFKNLQLPYSKKDEISFTITLKEFANIVYLFKKTCPAGQLL